ncbi:MAG: lipid-A-disaccharide synthase [Elusimicrobia bacterium CG1_02_63_36]|nr:MAG: lipid-A-disaccharide synthase [Elusimicrobia bacterium CG1_02_63_36]
MSGSRTVLIVAGDPSGDLYGAMLVKALRRRSDDVRVIAAAGKLMRETLDERRGDRFLTDLASIAVTGFVEPARRIPMFFSLLSRIKRLFALERVDLFIPIDFYGFNRRVLGAADAAGIPSVYLISPQVWASRPGRIRMLKRFVSRMLVIFPFEERLYRESGVPVTWIGHPLLERLPAPDLDRSSGRSLRIGILPGSRGSELKRHLPLLLKAASRIAKDYPNLELSVFAAPQQPDAAYQPHVRRWRSPKGKRAGIVRESDYFERARQDLVLTSSGTATLENALLGLPMVVVYKLSWPTYFLARALVKVEHIAMPNILAGKRLVPELIQHEATAESIAAAALNILEDPRALHKMRRELAALRDVLGGSGAIDRAADAVLREIRSRKPSEAAR